MEAKVQEAFLFTFNNIVEMTIHSFDIVLKPGRHV